MRKKQYSHNVGVVLDEATYQQLAEVTNEREVTMSALIREVVSEKLNPETKGVKNHE